MPVLYICVGFVLAVLLLSLLSIKIKINLEFCASSGNIALAVNISSLFRRRQRNYPPRDINAILDYVAAAWKRRQEKKKEPSRGKKGKLALGAYYSLVKFVMERMVVERLDWESHIGLNDAMYTALSSGGLWAAKGIFVGLLSSKTRMRDIKLRVEPDFNNDKLTGHIYCILKMRIVHIILVALYFLALAVRGYINGYGTGKTDSSH